MNLLETDDNVLGDYSPEAGYQHELEKAEQLQREVEQGERKPSEAYVELRSIKEFLNEKLDKAIKAVEPGVVDEVTRLSDQEELIALGSKITHVQGRTSYKYKQCPMYKDVDSELKRVRELIKTATKNNVEIVDKQTGEMVEPVEMKQGKGYLRLEKA